MTSLEGAALMFVAQTSPHPTQVAHLAAFLSRTALTGRGGVSSSVGFNILSAEAPAPAPAQAQLPGPPSHTRSCSDAPTSQENCVLRLHR